MRFFKGARTRLYGRALILVATCATSLAAAGAAHAATLTVNSTADNGPGTCGSTCTLRDAINSSSAGDTIVVPAGTYTLSQGQLEVSHDLTINGAGASSVTVSGGSGDTQSRVFYIDYDTTVTISGMTITDGDAVGSNESNGYGGGIFSFGALSLNDSVVTANSAEWGGGGIYEEDGTLAIDGSTVSDNTVGSSDDYGGGITCYCFGVSVNDSTISGNHDISGDGDDEGGGIYLGLSSGEAAVKAQLAGPRVGAPGTAQITNSTVSGNSMDYAGGGIYLSYGELDMQNTTISGNNAGNSGGGIYDDSSGTLYSTNNTVASNSSPDGANIYAYDNSSGGFENTLVAEPQGGGENCSSDDTSLPPSQGHNLEDDAGQSCGFTASGDLSGVSADLGGLANNGGPTETMALLAGSAAIDHGATISSITTDQRGGPRPQPAGGAYDIGSYERGSLVDTGITKTASPSPVKKGRHLTYTLTATNNGPSPDPAFGVTVTDKLPASEKYDSAKASQGSCSFSSGTLTCDLGTVNKGSSATVTLVVTPKKVGEVTNTATVSSSAKDPNSANDQASVTTKVKSAAGAPQVITGGTSEIGTNSVWLHGQVDPNGASTTYYFVYGTTPGDPRTRSVSAGKGTHFHGVRQRLTRLRPHTKYYYRIVAHNAHGRRAGRVRSFRTSAAAVKPVFTG